MLKAFNLSFEKVNSVHHKSKQRLLLFKKKVEIPCSKNWRQISLINVDIKITFKALAFRGKKFFPVLLIMIKLHTLKGGI